MNPWIGVDLDATLARYDGFKGETIIGEPIPLMVNRVKRWLEEDKEVRIFTARVAPYENRDLEAVRTAIHDWCEVHIGQKLAVTCIKDHGMVAFYDDRAHRVEANTGIVLC